MYCNEEAKSHRGASWRSGCGWWVLPIALLASAGCGRGQPSDAQAASPPSAASSAIGAETQVLNVYNWPDYVAEDTIRNFEARTGIKVNYTVYSNNDVLVQQLAATPDRYDVVFPSAQPYAQQLLAKGAFAALDKRNLGNLKYLDPAILSDLDRIDAGNAHLVPYMWGTTGLGVNLDKARAALGGAAVDNSWSLLFDPATAAKLSTCGIGVLDDDLEAFSAALIWKGIDPNSDDESTAAAAREVFAGIDRYVREYSNSSKLIEGLADGSLCLAMTYSGDVRQAQARAQELAEKNRRKVPEIRYVIPREGALRWMDVVAIPKQAKHVDSAHRFIQYLMEPQVIASISNTVAYANANTAASKLLDADIVEDPGVYPPADIRAKLRTARITSDTFTAMRENIWNEVVYGQL